MKANELKRGMVFLADAKNIVIKRVQVQASPSRSGITLYKVRGYDIVTRQKFEQSYKGDDNLSMVDISRCAVQPLYRDANGWTFMNDDTYEQYALTDSMIEDELPYITEGLEGINAIIVNDVVLGIELPGTVVLTIVECMPGMKVAGTSSQTKPATLSNGMIVNVPEYLTSGENIKVNTETGEYISRV